MDNATRVCRTKAGKLVSDIFSTYLEDTSPERFAGQTRALNAAGKTGNIGAYLPALTDVVCGQLRRSTENLAKTYVTEFTAFGIPCDPETEFELERNAQLVAGSAAGTIRCGLELFEIRTKRNLNLTAGLGHIQRSIAASMNMAVRKGRISLRQQRIQVSRPEALTGIGSCRKSPKKRLQESIVRQGDQKIIHHAANPPLAYPSWRYQGIKPGKIVKDAAEDAALGPGWVKNPDAFSWNNFKDRVWTQQDPDPLWWSAEWLGPILGDRVRDSIRAQLLKAHSIFLALSAGSSLSEVVEERIAKPFSAPPVNPDAYQQVMKHAFSGIAGVLHKFRLLQTGHLISEIPIFVSDTAVAAGWWPRPASEAISAAYSEQYGHYWFCGGCGHSRLIGKLFEAIVMEWTGTLLEDSAAEVPENRGGSGATRRGIPAPSKSKYSRIDLALKEIAKAEPEDHGEVFALLASRKIGIPDAEPFRSARGWLEGFQRNPVAARAWLSKRWGGLSLRGFSKGPKK